MSAPLDPAEIERVLAERDAAYDAQDALMELYRDERNIEELRKLSNEIVWPSWSRHTLGPCMPGCEMAHSEDDAHEDIVPHRVTVAEIPTGTSGRIASVDWGYADDLPAGVRGPVEVIVDGASDGLSPDASRELARQIVRAASHAEQWAWAMQEAAR